MSASALRERILDATRGTPAPTRQVRLLRDRLGVVASVGGMLAIFLWAGGLRAAPRPSDLILETALGAAAIAVFALTVLVARGNSTLGRRRRFLLLCLPAIPVLLFTWKLFWSARHPDMTALWPTRIGLRCLGLSLAMGLGPLLALALLRRDRDPLHPTVTGAALGVAIGACVWVMIDLWCPVAYPPHLLLGHVLPMALLGGLGALLGWRWIALRER